MQNSGAPTNDQERILQELLRQHIRRNNSSTSRTGMSIGFQASHQGNAANTTDRASVESALLSSIMSSAANPPHVFTGSQHENLVHRVLSSNSNLATSSVDESNLARHPQPNQGSELSSLDSEASVSQTSDRSSSLITGTFSQHLSDEQLLASILVNRQREQNLLNQQINTNRQENPSQLLTRMLSELQDRGTNICAPTSNLSLSNILEELQRSGAESLQQRPDSLPLPTLLSQSHLSSSQLIDTLLNQRIGNTLQNQLTAPGGPTDSAVIAALNEIQTNQRRNTLLQSLVSVLTQSQHQGSLTNERLPLQGGISSFLQSLGPQSFGSNVSDAVLHPSGTFLTNPDVGRRPQREISEHAKPGDSQGASKTSRSRPSKRDTLRARQPPKPFQPTNRPSVRLCLGSDDGVLSPYQCLLRKQIECFEAKSPDIQTKAQGRNTPIFLGQIGIRCIHCARRPVTERSSGSTFYSQSLKGVYQIAQNMYQTHFMRRCTNIPEEVRQDLGKLRGAPFRGTGGKAYWIEALTQLGIKEDDGILKFFKEESTSSKTEESGTLKRKAPSSPSSRAD